MTVRITKSEFNIREKLSELDIPVGNHGSQLMRSSTVGESQRLLQIKNRKNYFINGDCRIWQRGTSNPNVNNYGCDRWWKANGATQMDRSTDVPAYNTTGALGFSYSMKVTSNGSGSTIGQPIELIDTGVSQFPNGKQYTLSFYAKSDSGTGDLSVVVYYRNTKFSGTNQIDWEPNHAPHVGTMGRGWQRYSFVFTAPAVNSNNTMVGFELNFNVTAYFTGFQLEDGPQATPFEFTNKAEELALCQRYFFRMKPADNYSSYGMGGAYSSTQAVAFMYFPVPMRVSPSFSYSGALSTFYDKVGGFNSSGDFTNITKTQTMGTALTGIPHLELLVTVASGGTSGNPFVLATENTTNTHFDFDAEL